VRALIVSDNGDYLGLGMHLADEGHEVYFATSSKNGEGILTSASRLPSGEQPDLVIIDSQKYAVRKNTQFSGGIFYESLCKNRVYGYGLMKLVGIEIPEYKMFAERDHLIKFVEATQVDGELYPLQGAPVVEGKLDWQEILALLQTDDVSIGMPLLLCEHKAGIRIDIIGLFNGQDFVYPPAFVLPEQGDKDSCVVHLLEPTSRLWETTLAKLVRTLRKTDFRGGLMMSVVIDDRHQLWGVDLLPYIKPPALWAYLELLGTPYSEVFKGCADGSLEHADRPFIRDWAVCIGISSQAYGQPILGLTEPMLKHLWFKGVCAKDTGYHQTTDKLVMWVSARGRTLREARRRAYRTINNLKMREKVYPPYIGKTVANVMRKVKQGRWLS